MQVQYMKTHAVSCMQAWQPIATISKIYHKSMHAIVTKFAYLLFPKHEQVIDFSLKECSTIDPLIGGNVDKEPSPMLLYVFIEPCIEGFMLLGWGNNGILWCWYNAYTSTLILQHFNVLHSFSLLYKNTIGN